MPRKNAMCLINKRPPSQGAFAHRDGGQLFLRHIAFFRGICRKQLFSPCGILFAQLRRVLQNPEQVSVRIQLVFLCRFHQAVDHSTGPRTTRRIGKQPVLPAHHKGLNAALGTVVAQLQTAILQIPCQIRPLLQQVIDGLSQCGFRRSSNGTFRNIPLLW